MIQIDVAGFDFATLNCCYAMLGRVPDVFTGPILIQSLCVRIILIELQA
jgi:hypothetical protein